MKPTEKTKEIDDVLNDISGDNRKEAITENRCLKPPIGCGKSVKPETWDPLTQKEFTISGLCSECQDKVFG